MSISGLDVGTTGCKITVYDDLGNYLFRIYRNYPISRLTSGHEVDAKSIWSAVQEVIAEAAARVSDLKGIGITTFGETFVLLDETDSLLMPAMLYTDPRGTQECEKLRALLGEKTVWEITGLNPHPMYSISKLMWVKENHPDIWNRVKRICLMEDYIVYMLTGQAQIDYSIASRTMAFNICKLDWSETVLAAAGIDKRLFSKPVPTGTTAGTIRKKLAEKLGVPADCKIVSVAHDQVAAAIGSGTFEEGSAVDGAGTVECITPVFDSIPKHEIIRKGSFAIVPYVIPGKYICYAFSFTGGALIDWYLSNMAGYAAQRAKSQGKSIYSVLESEMKEGPTGILVLPHFAGAATPYMDPGSKGVIAGLTVSTSESDLYRAVMEGVVYEMQLNLEWLSTAGITFSCLRATGGGAASEVWMQMKADILGLPMVSLGSKEAGATGSAMLTGIAVGLFEDLQHACKTMVLQEKTYSPRADYHAAYQEVYQRYRQLYHAVRPIL